VTTQASKPLSDARTIKIYLVKVFVLTKPVTVSPPCDRRRTNTISDIIKTL